MPEIRKINPDIRIILTAASGTDGGFSKTVSDTRLLDAATDSLVSDMLKFDLDGLDIDWEYPSVNGIKEESHGHTLLLEKLREKLDAVSTLQRRYSLSIAAGCKDWYFTITELGTSQIYLDYVNLMTYDINAGNHYTMHHTCTYPMQTELERQGSVMENVEVFEEFGVPRDKIIVGAGFYSRQWNNVKNENNGLFAFSGEESIYGPGYTQLVRDYVNKNGYVRYWDDDAKAPYLFNGDNFITYDDEESLRYKCRYVKESGIAGIMIWEYSCDEENILVKIMRDELDKA